MFKSSALNNFNLPFYSDEFSHPPVQLTVHSVLHRTAGWFSEAPAAVKSFWNVEVAATHRGSGGRLVKTYR